MAIRLYVLRVFEQFSCTEDPVASNPYRTSRLRGEGEGGRREKGEEGEGGGGGKEGEETTGCEVLNDWTVNEKDLIAVLEP